MSILLLNAVLDIDKRYE